MPNIRVNENQVDHSLYLSYGQRIRDSSGLVYGYLGVLLETGFEEVIPTRSLKSWQ